MSKHRVCRSISSTAHTHEHHLDGGFCSSSAASAHEVAAEIVRHELSYFLRLPLCPPLVQSLESEMVCGLFPDHISSAAAAVGGVDIHGSSGLDMAYMAVQLAAILLLAVGVYRFSLLWVSPRAASFAALASVFLGSESFLVYSAGQLGTTSAAPIYLNALPYLYRLGPAWQVAIVSQGERAVHGRRRRSPCHAALRVDVFRAARRWRWCSWTARTASRPRVPAFCDSHRHDHRWWLAPRSPSCFCRSGLR